MNNKTKVTIPYSSLTSEVGGMHNRNEANLQVSAFQNGEDFYTSSVSLRCERWSSDLLEMVSQLELLLSEYHPVVYNNPVFEKKDFRLYVQGYYGANFGVCISKHHDYESDQGRYLFDFYTTDVNLFHKLKIFASDWFVFFDKKPKDGKIFSLVTGRGGSVQISAIGNLKANRLVRENYSQEVIEDVDFVINEFSSSEPSGRLTVIYGEPGTGKTHLIKGLVSQSEDLAYVIVSPEMIPNIGNPSFITTLINFKDENFYDQSNLSIILILEDADQCLTVRDEKNMPYVQSLLNVTAGIYGDLFNIKVVATTNAKIVQLDPALVREGRLNKMINIGPLPAEHANNLLYSKVCEKFKLTKEEALLKYSNFKFTEPTVLARVYEVLNQGQNHSNNIKKKKENKVGFSN